MNFKADDIDDTFFKDKFDCSDFEDSIYNQLARTMARNADIDLAKTPLVDILTGYTRYRILQSKIEKAIDKLEDLKCDAKFDNCYATMKLDEIQEILEEDK